MSAILSETVVPLGEIARRAPGGRGSGPSHAAHRTTVLRWVLRGVKVGAARVKLEAVRVGGRWSTSEEAYQRFLAACNPGAVAPVPERSLAERTRAHTRAVKQYERLVAEAK